MQLNPFSIFHLLMLDSITQYFSQKITKSTSIINRLKLATDTYLSQNSIKNKLKKEIISNSQFSRSIIQPGCFEEKPVQPLSSFPAIQDPVSHYTAGHKNHLAI